ncbi:putative small GTPase, EF-hand domain pair, P-loop containing nucleoside triphosphate hydrolase [Helianthus annuus]|uniref:Mitochondrial Rho GTPase n=1 Tax=Helianthus annuus TaxID=4232 RepID=A0A251SIY2_HELAN|nr:mitochondrial Rho GTPase 1 [Helianthus annuus]KAF5769454.1 putative small GTPase, EF-hand domain pair, P-loop containing nucleoside triphosphate hydrolase [Helianthus annuus]KAJ0486055.1 putative small GTPase, EF-hand domain, EF-hand domain pair, EF hand associated, type-1, MIRO [Helianthus annuus]KAJ0656609.1 putative small GTPase, EF-hand domain, EF-hand domain pair, EF hand associated, type-1, MIRO [Helianthus annuus]
MAGGGTSAAKSSSTTTGVRIVVAGDRGTGKSSLIITAAAESFPTNVPPVLPPTRLPEDMFPEHVPVTVIDTSSSLENRGKLADELKRADAVVLTYACDEPSTLDRLSTFWLPELRRLEVKVPVIVAGCKLDLRDEQQAVSLELVMSPIMQQFREIETCIECSAYKHIQIPEVFYYAQKAVLHPTAPLFDQEAQTLKPRCVRALKRIFILCDHDRDGALSDAELNDFQVKCFNAPLQPSEIVGVKRVVQEKLPEGVNENGLTLTGFLFLHALFIEKGRLETTWTVLRKYGYNNDIRLGDDQLLAPIKRTPDQSVELTSEAVEFLRGVFTLFDSDGDGALNAHELEDLFSTAPESPWNEAPYASAAEKNALGGLSLDGFLSEWAFMTVLDPVLSVENLIYIGYAGDPSSAVRVTRKRRVDRKKQSSDRNVFQCFVFGPKEAGKSSLLHSFVGRQFTEAYTPTTEERYAVNTVDQPDGTKKTLILREIPEDAIGKLLVNKDALAACDIAVFVHDSSNASSWTRATELLVQVASHGESTGYEVPCLIVAAKDDLEPYPTAIQDSTRVSQDMGIEAPIPISTKLGDFNNVFRRIVRAAEHPHLSIPETEAGKSRKQYHRVLNRSLMVVSVGAAVAIVGLAAYRVYATRKNASS